MAPLLLVAAAGLAGYFILSDKKPAKSISNTSLSKPSNTSKIDYTKLAEKGYYFVDCKTVVVKDEKKAFDYIYKIAKNTNIFLWDGLIFDGCVGNVVKQFQYEMSTNVVVDQKKFSGLIKNSEQAKFLFNALKYIALAMIENGLEEKKDAIELLEKFKKFATDDGVDTSKWEATLPNEATKTNFAEIKDDTWEKYVLNSKGPTLVHFFDELDTDSIQLDKDLQKIQIQKPGLTIYRANPELNPTAVQFYDIKSVPTILIFEDGQLVGRKDWSLSEHDLSYFIDYTVGNTVVQGFSYNCNSLITTNIEQRNTSLILIQEIVASELKISGANMFHIDPIAYSKHLISIVNPNCIKNPQNMTIIEKGLYLLFTIGLYGNIPVIIKEPLDPESKKQKWIENVQNAKLILKNYLHILDSEIPTIIEIEKQIGQTGNYP